MTDRMKLSRLFAILLLSVCFLTGALAVVTPDDTAIRKRAACLTLEQVLREGERLAGEGHEDRGISLLSAGADRYSAGMSEYQKRQCVDIIMRIGKIQYSLSNYSEALRQFMRALDISEECASRPSIMEIYNCIGLAYCGFEDYETGLRFMRTGYSLRSKYPDRTSESNLLLNLAGYSCEVGRPAEAQRYLDLARKIIAPTDSMRQYMIIYNDGYIKAGEKRYAEACRLFHRAAGYLDSPERRCYAYDRLYLTYKDWGKTDSMYHYLQKTYELALECGLRDLQIQTLRDLSDYYRNSDPLKSMEYGKQYLAMSDSVLNKRDFYALRNLQYTREADAHNRQMAELETKRAVDQERIRVQRFIIIGVVLLLLSAAVFVTVLIRQKRALAASYADLFRQSKNLIRQEEAGRREVKRYEQTIRELQSTRSKEDAAELPSEMKKTEPDPAAEPQPKYSRSALSDTSKQKIRSEISRIVNDTEEIYSPDFTLNKLAQLVGSNNQYVSQIINEEYGKNFNDFTNEIRVRRACSCLLDTERYGQYSVQGIAEIIGFRSQSTFFRAFKKFVGFSPVVYQKMALREAAVAANL